MIQWPTTESVIPTGLSIAEFARDAVGIPWKAQGRDGFGVDCWGLVVLAYWHVSGIMLPGYEAEYQASDIRGMTDLIAEKATEWIRVAPPAPLDVALLYMRGRPFHVAVMIDSHRCLHVDRGVATCIEPISRFRVEGFYRPGMPPPPRCA